VLFLDESFKFGRILTNSREDVGRVLHGRRATSTCH